MLLFGGGIASQPSLNGWASYSKNFKFVWQNGVPGRVCSRQQIESKSDASVLPYDVFKRADGAKRFGLHAYAAFPVRVDKNSDAAVTVSNDIVGNTIVVVLYSVKTFEPSEALLGYVKLLLSKMNFSCSVRIQEATPVAASSVVEEL